MKIHNITYRKLKMYFDDKLGRKCRKLFRNKIERSKLTNVNFSVFSQNCIGSVMYNDLGLEFQSPTINMLFQPKDFIRFMKDINYYLEQPIVFVHSDFAYPIGYVGDVLIKFVHYHSEDEVTAAWKRRISRINWDNVFLLCCDEGLTQEDMIEFDSLPYKNKILFMHYYDPSIQCGVYTKDFPQKTDAVLLGFCSIFGKRFYQKYINYVNFFNGDNYLISNSDN